jgi:hypothetical protein
MRDNPIVDYWFEETAKQMGGLILEVGLDTGVDVLAAFADGRARFLNTNGDISMWEGGEGATAGLVSKLLGCAAPIVAKAAAQPWERLDSPADGSIRISTFGSGGMHLEQGTIEEFANHPLFDAGVDLMNALEGI